MQFKEFMDTLDFQHRWIYLGSAAFPPCMKYLLWNILKTRYHIEYKYTYYIKQIFADNFDELKSKHNIRGIYPVNGHRVYYIEAVCLKLALMTYIILALFILG